MWNKVKKFNKIGQTRDFWDLVLYNFHCYSRNLVSVRDTGH